MSSAIRLNKFIAERTGVSRREADEMISAQRVEVKSQELRDESQVRAIIGQRVEPGDEVFIDGKLIKNEAGHTTLILNKPAGYLSSRRSQAGDPTVYDLLPPKYKSLKTAGRLDRDSSGLMILSSDGDLIQQLTHPRYEKVKIYEVELDKPLEPLHQQMISDFGVDLDDGKSKFSIEKLDSRLSSLVSTRLWRVTMHEGRNRQIRRTFAALGYTVTELHRTQVGKYSLGSLKPGGFELVN